MLYRIMIIRCFVFQISGSCDAWFCSCLPLQEELHDGTAKVMASMMCADIVVNSVKYSPVIESYRKVCKFMAKRLGLSPADLPSLLKSKLDALTNETLS